MIKPEVPAIGSQ